MSFGSHLTPPPMYFSSLFYKKALKNVLKPTEGPLSTLDSEGVIKNHRPSRVFDGRLRRHCYKCRPVPRLPRRVWRHASQIRYKKNRNHEERLRRDVVIPCKHWHPCRPVPRLLRAKALASSRIFFILLKNNQRIKTANEVKQSHASIGTRADQGKDCRACCCRLASSIYI